MDSLFILFLKSLSAATKSDPKKLWRQIKAHFVSRTWYHGPKKSFYFDVDGNNFIPLSRDALAEEMCVRGLFHVPKTSLQKATLKHEPKDTKAKNKEKLQYKLLEFLSTVRESHRVD